MQFSHFLTNFLWPVKWGLTGKPDKLFDRILSGQNPVNFHHYTKSHYSFHMRPQSQMVCDVALLSSVEFWVRNHVKSARRRGEYRATSANKKRGFHALPDSEIYTSEYNKFYCDSDRANLWDRACGAYEMVHLPFACRMRMGRHSLIWERDVDRDEEHGAEVQWGQWLRGQWEPPRKNGVILWYQGPLSKETFFFERGFSLMTFTHFTLRGGLRRTGQKECLWNEVAWIISWFNGPNVVKGEGSKK